MKICFLALRVNFLLRKFVSTLAVMVLAPYSVNPGNNTAKDTTQRNEHF
jgi:hypothetical protein